MGQLLGVSLPLGTYFGIPVKVHWSFSLFIFFIIYIIWERGMDASESIWFGAYVLLLFVFVIMHEYGHALSARRYGVRTRDIIISPIGGIARLERLPERPWHELIVALAGPAVNLFLAILLLAIQFFYYPEILPNVSGEMRFDVLPNFLAYLLILNVVLVVFNMIPAFPMDGGRVLRAGLQIILKNRYKATLWAVRIGQVIAVAFIALALYHDYTTLGFIGAFVFLTARRELQYMQQQNKMTNTTAADMAKELPVYFRGDQMSSVSDADRDSDIMVAGHGDEIVGVVPHLLMEHQPDVFLANFRVGDVMTQQYGELDGGLSMIDVFNSLNDNGWVVGRVANADGCHSGYVSRMQLEEFLGQKKKK